MSEDKKIDRGLEDFCFLCHRPESKTGKMVHMGNDICVCSQCMQKAYDTMRSGNFPYQGAGFPNMNLNGVPNFYENPGTFFGTPGNSEEAGKKIEEGENQKGSSSGKRAEENTDGNLDEMDDNENDQQEQDEQDEMDIMSDFAGMPNVSMINLGDLLGQIPKRQRVKKKKKGASKKNFQLKDIPAPHKIKASLDEYVIGQEYAKKVISVAVYNHYKRIAAEEKPGVEIEKSNMLMIGPTGSGKTYLVKTLAKLLDVPLAIADATSLTEAGYIGDDIESVVSKLLAAADNDVERAEHGIIFIDEIDKIAKKKNTNQRDVSGESVQQGMLKLLEGSEIEVPVGATSKNAMVPMETINTRNILFICGGAFPGLEDIIRERLNRQASVGFQADLRDKYDKDPKILEKVTVEDIRQFGMIPEFIGRLPVIFTLEGLSEDMLVEILRKPKNAILKQYERLLELDEVKLDFEEDALREIARKAREKDTGARALRAIIEEFMLDIMYEIPKDENIGSVTITKEYIQGTGAPIIRMRGVPSLEG